eukprot:2746511-Prymnesium_polylepis.1
MHATRGARPRSTICGDSSLAPTWPIRERCRPWPRGSTSRWSFAASRRCVGREATPPPPQAAA